MDGFMQHATLARFLREQGLDAEAIAALRTAGAI